MIQGLCQEVEKRMTKVGVKGVKVTLKVKQRKADAPPPPKFLGHGSCHNLSKSAGIKAGVATRDWKCFYEVASNIYSDLNVDKMDVRGMGIVVSKLVADASGDTVVLSDPQGIAKWFNGGEAKSDTAKSHRKVDFILPASIPEEFAESDGNSSCSDILWVGSSSTKSIPAVEDDIHDIELPALSQIHMSQVNELPSPLRNKIMLTMKNEKSKGIRLHAVPYDSHTSARDTRFRQTDVKRMFRLAAVKSGATALLNECGQTVSLTQLDCLPLELQLELANKDSSGLGSLSPDKTIRKAAVSAHLKSGRTSETAQECEQIVDNSSSIALRANETADCHVTATQSLKGTANFVRENLRPLALFMDENPQVETAAMKQVIDFLCICVSENRLSDTFLLLRNISRRSDLWSANFDSIFDAVNNQVQVYFRASLDKDWLLQL
jgi:impB/mucB/samB family C-terminal domain